MKTAHRYVVLRPDLLPSPRKKMGAGEALKRGIRSVVSAMPIPKKTKESILNCSGCDQRAKALDRVIPDVTDPFKIGGDA